MLKSHEKFHSANGKRQILIAEDQQINRELLGLYLQDEYELLYACDGGETLEMIRAHRETLSLILLDIIMPVMSGIEVLKIIRADDSLNHIPVIVTTAEPETEIECLDLGAADFISKNYPPREVFSARVRHAIELSEDRDIIKFTERDELTGLYNRDYFYRYAEQFDQHHKDVDTDAIIVDVNHFHMINERYGKAYGDSVLRRIGLQLRETVADSDGIVCRRNADTFMVYCRHREDYEEILEQASLCLMDESTSENRIRLRMGIYQNVDKSVDIERRFDWAKQASDKVRGNLSRRIETYNDDMRIQQIREEQMIEDFSEAIAGGQFQVYYQPKFDIRPDTPVLASAEALVRWIHPTRGMISPGEFIPLFEKNGLIQKLDLYVWQETARQIRQWREELNYSVPVSVNLSRVDIYDEHLPETLLSILEEFDITGRDLLLEVTESAYTQDQDQIVEMIVRLREMGFRIEMDDFGTGYSSLNMISKLPIDALKLDMLFVRDAFRQGGDEHLVNLIIDISKHLNVPVIAEGVETDTQLHRLRELGCDLVQGYFFSKPIPAGEFEAFILQKKEADMARVEKADRAAADMTEKGAAEDAPRAAEETGAKEQPAREQGARPHTDRKRTAIQLKTESIIFVMIAVIVAVSLMITDLAVARGYQRMDAASDRYMAAQRAAADMQEGSDYLTDRVRSFVVTGEIDYLRDFYEELEVTRQRDHAVEELEYLLEGEDTTALDDLSMALRLSNALVQTENYAMRLIVEAEGYDDRKVPEKILGIQIREEDRNLTKEQMREKAREMVFDSNYAHYKKRIQTNVDLCTQALIKSSGSELEASSARLLTMTNIRTALTILLLLLVIINVVVITGMVRRPLTRMVRQMQKQEIIEPIGVEELRFVTRTYNRILHENEEAREKLRHQASHDALTGLFNRGAYDLLMKSADSKHMALLLIDVDYFKQVNDTYGHAVGDRILQKVADILRHSFRSVDHLCRIGGDEFAVIMTRVNSSHSQLVLDKIEKANKMLQFPEDSLPPVSLSVGVAFSDRENPEGDIFKDADTALYRVKKAGRKGCAIY